MSRGGNRGGRKGQENGNETVGTKPTRLQKLCFEAIQSMPRGGVRVPGHVQAVVLQISACGPFRFTSPTKAPIDLIIRVIPLLYNAAQIVMSSSIENDKYNGFRVALGALCEL